MSSSKGGGVEAALKVNSLADVGGITCADPGAIGDANLKSTRCEISQGAPVCCGGAKWSSGTDAYNTCWKYDSATNGWDLMSGINMIGKRYGGHMVELDDGRIWYTGW